MAAAFTIEAPQEQAWVTRLMSQQAITPEHQNLKFTLHRKLLDRVNLQVLSSIATDHIRSEVRAALVRLVEE
jgi:pilus assembly protein CpaF